jgi:hypothetical protein
MLSESPPGLYQKKMDVVKYVPLCVSQCITISNRDKERFLGVVDVTIEDSAGESGLRGYLTESDGVAVLSTTLPGY